MEKWELFLRGFGRSLEEFITRMIDKGTDHKRIHEEVTAEVKPSKKRTIPRLELGDLEDRIVDVVRKYPNGCTLKDIAKNLDMQWHYLRIPLRQMLFDGKVEKDGKVYTTAKKAETPVQTVERDGVRRRIVDAKALEKTPEEKPKPAKVELSSREKEILRFKILTAFRGRPEGLTLVELAAVLGRNLEGLNEITEELIEEKKIAIGKGGKYHLA
ncbi:hypothetical protein JW979_08085 [bacterium]|nr:hypothetical protein [candidate division CSSED10-310 bacterium]